MVIIRFKAILVQLDLPTGTELGNKVIVNPILTIQNKFIDQGEPSQPPLGNRVNLYPISRHLEPSNSTPFDTFLVAPPSGGGC